MFDIAPGDPIIKAYLADLSRLKGEGVTHELGLKAPFQTLLDKAAKRRGWTLVAELSTHSGGKRVVPDGTVRDEYRLPRGWWEAKDSGDKLAKEIAAKLKAGYPSRNTIFEDTDTAVLYQDRREAGEFPLHADVSVAELLQRFLSHDESDERELHRALDDFKARIPDLSQSLHEHLQHAHKKNAKFQTAFGDFVALCRASLNPDLSEARVDEMLIQHLLTERLMRNLFQNPEFTKRNVIAAQVENVIEALASSSFNKTEFLKRLDPYYKAIERAGANLNHFTEKQEFLNSIYEQFFQRFSPATADTHGIVYTPPEIVDYMCGAVDRALKEEFGLSLASKEVAILDPCTGTGNFIVNLLKRIPGKHLREAYKERLFANEVMLLPYYVASLNIEHAYYERMKEYEAFEGLCFVDTLDMAEAKQPNLFTPANTERVERERKAAITVILGNPPYNVGQRSENENNPNRKYKEVDGRIRDTYAKDSKATNKNALADMYVKFFRWASDRLGNRDGVVCFVSNNGFFAGVAFDGFRKNLAREFSRIDHLDLLGNARTSGERRRDEGGNVFDDQIRTGVGITLLVRKKGCPNTIRYHRVPVRWKASEKRQFLASGGEIPWQTLTPDAANTWLVPENADEWSSYTAIEDLFDLHSRGVQTARDAVAYDWNRDRLVDRIRKFIDVYNTEVFRHTANPDADWPDHIDWSRDLKQDVRRGRIVEFQDSKVRPSLYRPFAKRWLYFDRILNEEIYQWLNIPDTRSICITAHTQVPFSAILTDTIPNEAPGGRQGQCFPLSHFRGSEDDFYAIYALLHHRDYREHYAANLKLSLPRIPQPLPNRKAFAKAGRALAELHVNYESLDPWPLDFVETKGVPYSEYVAKMKLAADKTALRVNDSLTLAGIPPEAFEYKLGSRSALEWAIDQYRVKGDSDPNRADDPGYIVRLVGQVVRVSVETVKIVRDLPGYRPE